jgi:arginine-tRNA-protein transferase
MINMFADKHYPENLNLWELDQYLEKGWYRMGQVIFTTHFLFFGSNVYSALWIRLPLLNYQFKGTNRKLLNKITSQFNIIVRPAEINDEKDNLYDIYADNFDGNLAPNLNDMLLEFSEESIYDTWEIAIYDRGNLIACSFFDRGFSSIASIFAMYHPDYEKYSLGYFTLLAEIDYAKNHGYTYFYPGYVVPGNKRFDYKLRIGQVAFYDLKSENWIDYSTLNMENIPIHQIDRKLDSMKEYFTGKNFPTKKMFYTFFEINLVSLGLVSKSDYLEYPIVLLIPDTNYLLISFDPRTELFHLLKCKDLFEEKQFLIDYMMLKYEPDSFFNHLVIIDSIIESSPNIHTIYNAVLSVQAQRG